MRRNILAAVAACAWSFGCAAVFLQTDDFPDKLKKGCDSLEACERLETEASARVERCQDNTVGYIRCNDARADLDTASRYANQWRSRAERAEQDRREAEVRKDEADRRAAQGRADEAREAKELEERHKREDADREREAQRLAAKELDHARELEYLRLLGPAGREQKLRTCVKDSGPGVCASLVMEMGEAVGDTKETAKLARINDTPPPASPPPEASSRSSSSRSISSSGDDSGGSGGGDSLLCCDGTLSPSCSCSGSHRGCCSHHHGVCGCQ